MTPPFLFLSLSSIFMIWIIISVGLPSYCWTYFVVPCVSVYCLCDQQKLSEKVVREFTKSFRGGSISVAILAALYTGYFPWKMVILLCCIFCLIKAFSSEKMMFSGDYFGELAKFAWWRLTKKFVQNQFDRMGWSGDWFFCSPYSRAPCRKNINFYYVLSKSESREERHPVSFDLEFDIEDCEVKCNYFVAGADVRSSENGIGSRTAVPETIQEPLAATVCDDEAGTSSSQRPSGADVCLLPRTRVVLRPVQNQTQTQVNKLEVTLCLLQGGEEIQSFTFFQLEGDRVVEITRAMEVLRKHGNLIFSSFHRDIGSRTPRAHAGCYEFEEIFELILNEGYTVQKVNLSGQHACSISGKTLMYVLQTVVIVWMQYYQLSSAPTPSLITMLVLFAFFQLFFIFLDNILGKKKAAKEFLHSLIKCFMPNEVGSWYEYFQVKWPRLTFCNESYGHPYTIEDCRVICCFVGTTVQAVSTKTEYFTEDTMFDVGVSDYNLRNVNLELDIRRDEADDELEGLLVFVTCRWARNGEMIYHSVFRVLDNRKISNLIAVLKWLKDNNCQGVCKKWKKNKMHVFTYEELIGKILDESYYYRPWLNHFNNSMTIHVE